MTRHPGDHGYTAAPGPALVDARRTEATRQKYADVTTRMWAEAWEPPHPDGRGPLAYALDTADNYERASRR